MTDLVAGFGLTYSRLELNLNTAVTDNTYITIFDDSLNSFIYSRLDSIIRIATDTGVGGAAVNMRLDTATRVARGSFTAGTAYNFGVLPADFDGTLSSGSSVDIVIPTESIDELVDITTGLTTATALRDDLLTSLQANTNINSEFTITAGTADSRTTGVTAGEPIVILTANDNTDHSIAVTFNNGADGDLSGSRFGSHVDGDATSFVSTEVRVVYDSNINPSMQDIVIGQTANSAATATVIASMIDAQGDLTAEHITTQSQRPDSLFELDRGDATFSVDQYDVNNGGILFTGTNNPYPVNTGDYTGSVGVGLGLAFNNAQVGTSIPLDQDITIQSVTDDDIFLTGQATTRINAGNDVVYLFRIDAAGGTFSGTEGIRIFEGAIEPIVDIEIVRITSNPGIFTEPTFTVTTQGTTTDVPTFAVSTFQNGTAPNPSGIGVRSRFAVSYAGTEVISSTELPSGADSATAGATIRAAIDALLTQTATGDDPFTVTSVANSAADIIVTLSLGTNDDGTTPDIAIARSVTQTGSAVDVFGGTDGSVEPFVGNRSLGVIDIAGMSLNDIAIAVASAFTTDGTFAGQVTGPELEITAQFTGIMNPATVNVNAGTNSDGTAADFAIARTVLDDGMGTTTTAGSAATYIILLDTTQVATGTFASNSSPSAAAAVLQNALTAVESFSGAVNGDVLRATSATPTRVPDITITITPGVDPDGTPGTLAAAKTVVQEGEAPRIDYSTTVWTYYVINQEVRVDDDTTAMMPDNTITIPQGLVVNTENITASSTTGTATAAMTYLTGAARSNLVITGGVSEIVALTSTGTTTHVHTLEYSTDMGANWTAFFTTQAFNPNFGATFAGQAYNNVQFVGAQINDIPANSTVAFRGRDTGTAATGSWGFGFLVVEERNADMTT